MYSGFLCKELFFSLDTVRVGNATLVDGADGGTLRFVMEPDALGAEIRIDDVDRVSLADGIVRTLRKTGPTGNTVVGNQNRHSGLLDLSFNTLRLCCKEGEVFTASMFYKSQQRRMIVVS
jgi:hypothetical protein